MGKLSPSARYRFIYSVLTIICLALRTGNTLCHWHRVFVWNLLPKMVRVWLLTILSLILLFFILLFFFVWSTELLVLKTFAPRPLQQNTVDPLQQKTVCQTLCG